MAQDVSQARSQGNFSLTDPTQALIHDHNYVKQLMQRYLSAQVPEVKKQAGPEICSTLQTHSRLEESVFYPRVHELNPTLIDKFESDHQAADEIIEKMQALEAGVAEYDELMQSLQEAIVAHIELEETQLFPLVRTSNMDLQDLALRMQAYESNIVATQASSTPRAQPGTSML